MTDTPAHTQLLYVNFIIKKSDAEHFQMGIGMAETGRSMVEVNLRHQHPEWSDAQLKAAVFERIYWNDFSPDELARIKQACVTFHDTTNARLPQIW